MTWRLGIDVGGTFTDLALVEDETGEVLVHKVGTDSRDIAEGCLQGIAALLARSRVPPGEVGYWSHGSTVATNAVVQRRGARTALVTTKGFRDVLELRRQIKPDRYDLRNLKPEPLVARDWRLEVDERILADGSVFAPVESKSVAQAINFMRANGAEAAAICFLHAYSNDAHERAVADAIRAALPNLFTCASHEVIPQFREFERISTTIINAYVGPLVSGYLARFSQGGRRLGLESPLNVFQSNGGIISAAGATRRPVNVLFSGPAAGAAGAAFVGSQAGFPNLVTFDMGGTSCDICLVRDGLPVTTPQKEIVGFPVRARMVDVHAIGAGGGSIASVDRGNFMQVGPRSAGALPGPACYGLGGEDATVTDANVVLGRLHPEYLLGGQLPILAERSHAAIARVGQLFGASPIETAGGVIEIVNSNMVRAIRVVSVDRGHDPRDFALLAYGGAGPLHAAEVARELEIRRVIVPSVPGILCALGLLVADYRLDFSQTLVCELDAEAVTGLVAGFTDLEAGARTWVQEHQVPSGGIARAVRQVQMRYLGQSYELEVPIPDGPVGEDIAGELMRQFHRAHEQTYGFFNPGARMQLVGLHLVLTVPVARPQLSGVVGRRNGNPIDGPPEYREVYFRSEKRFLRSPVYQRSALAPQARMWGPAIIEQIDSTTLVLPDQHADVDEQGNLHLLDA